MRTNSSRSLRMSWAEEAGGGSSSCVGPGNPRVRGPSPSARELRTAEAAPRDGGRRWKAGFLILDLKDSDGEELDWWGFFFL
jgi:hypothetical protein